MTPIQKLLSLIIPFKRQSKYDRRYDPPSNTEPDIDAVTTAITAAECGNFLPFSQIVKKMLSDDGHIQTEVAKRKLALLGDPLTMRPASKKPVDVAAAEECKRWSDDYSSFTDAMLWALDGVIWPNATSEKVFEPGTGGRRFDLALEPVDPALFDYSDGCFKLQKTVEGAPTGDIFAPDPARYWTYRGHLSTLADQRGGPARPLLFWHFMSHCSYNWWGRFLERFGAPFLVGKVDNMDSDEVYKLEDAFRQATRLFGVVVSRGTEIELMEARVADGGRAYEANHRLCQEEKSKIILGQYGTTQAVSSGLNGDTAGTLGKVRGDFRDWDSFRLGSSLRAHVLRQFMQVNAIPGSPPLPIWGDVSGENTVNGELLVQLAQIGILPGEDALDAISQGAGVSLRWAEGGPRDLRGGAAGFQEQHALAADDPFLLRLMRG
jgi:phage gp29-like protein